MSLMLDHCGVLDVAGNGLDPWRQDLSKLANLSHVLCKLSGITAYCAAGTRLNTHIASGTLPQQAVLALRSHKRVQCLRCVATKGCSACAA